MSLKKWTKGRKKRKKERRMRKKRKKNQEIERFEIAMNDAHRMEISHAVRSVKGPLQTGVPTEFDRLVLEDIEETSFSCQFADEERMNSVFYARPKHLDQTWMFQHAFW